MRIYFAGPLFTAAERDWNAALAAALRGAGHEVFLPQEQEPGKVAAGIFATDMGGLDWADGVVAIMDGADPDSGTSWEVGYAYGKKPIVLVRTDIRRNAGSGGSGYNPMLTESATSRVDAVAAPMDRVAREVLDALATLEAAPSARSADDSAPVNRFAGQERR
jgi:nucleoside 2-deoxyribosyltransferase